MVRVTLVLAAVVLAACGGSKKTDGGMGGGGGGTGGGAGGGSGGGGGGGGGGVPGECQLAVAASCDAGHCYQVNGSSGLMTQCLGGPCDVVAQDCAANFRCAYGLDGGRDCYPNGTLTEGAACGASVMADCAKGLTCVDGPLDDGGTGLACHAFCRSSSDCTGGRICYVSVDVGGPEVPLVCAAAPPTCDVFAQNCASTADGCYPTTTGPGCYPVGAVAVGGTCTHTNDCVPRATCASKSGSGGGPTCHLLCGTDGGSPYCPDGGVCGTLTGVSSAGVCF